MSALTGGHRRGYADQATAKSVAGLGTPQHVGATKTPYRVFFCGRLIWPTYAMAGCIGSLRGAVPTCGSSNPVQPATPSLEPLVGGYTNRYTSEVFMANCTCCCGDTAQTCPAVSSSRLAPSDLLSQLQAVRQRFHVAKRAAADSDRCIEATIGDGLRELSMLKRLVKAAQAPTCSAAARHLHARAAHFVRVARLHNWTALGYRKSREWPLWHNALAGRDGAMTCARELVEALRLLEVTD